MKARPLLFHDAARDKIRRGADALAEAVQVTMGPRGRTVILDREFGPPQIVNSGVLVARAVELEDPFENMGAHLLREVAARTSEMAGDGTTTATVLAAGMIHEGLRYLAGGMNPMDLKRGIERAIEAVVAELHHMAQPCATRQDVAHVAAISANNDTSIGDLLASAIDKVGREGAISIEDGSGLVSVLEVVEGLQFANGYLSSYFVNNAERQSAVLEDALVLLVDGRLASLAELLPLLEQVVKAAQPLLVIAEDIDNDTLAALVINHLRGSIKACAVKAPGFGNHRKAMLQDMAVLTGAQLVSEELGRSLGKLQLTDLGRAKRVEEGIVPGGGVALLRARRVLDALQGENLDETSGIRLVQRALEEPLRRIVANAGIEPSVVAEKVDATREPAFGYNAANRTYGDLLQMGVMDPAKVTRLALQNAASIAALVLTTDCMIALPAPAAPLAGSPAMPDLL